MLPIRISQSDSILRFIFLYYNSSNIQTIVEMVNNSDPPVGSVSQGHFKVSLTPHSLNIKLLLLISNLLQVNVQHYDNRIGVNLKINKFNNVFIQDNPLDDGHPLIFSSFSPEVEINLS